jgi:uncharacterized protein YndB with AHSA1/START domain
MGFLIRALKILIVFLLFAAVVFWFAARRGDRGYIEEAVTINRPATAVFRWITTDELLRRWISDLIKLEKIGSTGPFAQTGNIYRVDERIGTRNVSFNVRVNRTVQNQEIDFSVRAAFEASDSFISDAKFKLLPEGDDYTRVIFSSQTKFQGPADQIFEPILTYATQKKMQEDLERLKIMVEAEPASQPGVRGRPADR